jgi:hypothetical protein
MYYVLYVFTTIEFVKFFSNVQLSAFVKIDLFNFLIGSYKSMQRSLLDHLNME